MGKSPRIEKVLLTSCRSDHLDSDKVYPPLGILYLKSAINAARPYVQVDISDELRPGDLNNNYDLVGVSVMTPQRAEAERVLRSVKEYNPNTKVAIGGPHAQHYFEEASKLPHDYIVPNDGQRAILSIIDGEAPRVVRDVMDPEQWGKQPRPDRLSPEARAFLAKYSYTLDGKPSTTMLTATGCPMVCTFCEDAGTRTRWSPLEKIAKELDDIQELGYKGVYLFDDLFAIAMPKVKPIAEELKKRDLVYRCNGQANFFTKWGEQFAELLASTGCKEIAFGHESGSQKILDNVNKKTSVQQNRDSIRYAKKHGLKVKSFLMLGLPGETPETIAETERFIQEEQPDDFQLAVYYPYKGTQIRDAIDRGEEGFDLEFEGEGLGAYGQKGGKTESVVRTRAFTSAQLEAERDRLVRTYKPASHRMMNDKFFEQGKDC